MHTDERMVMNEEFYTQKRWNNWISKVKESNFTLTESGEGNVGAVFVYIMDDVILACLKVIARTERGLISKEEALSVIDSIRAIVFADHEPLGEDADLMLESLKDSLAAVFSSSQCYISGDYEHDTPLSELINQAVKSEKDGQLEKSLALVSQAGARVIGGEKLPEESIVDMDYCLVAELLDGLDAISAAMLGDDSYKEDDGTVDEET
jgi:hypothetical protein